MRDKKRNVQFIYLIYILVALMMLVGGFFLIYFGMLVLIMDISHGHDLKQKLLEYIFLFGLPGLLLMIFSSIWLSRSVKKFVMLKKINVILVIILILIAISGMIVIGVMFYVGV